MSARVLFKLDGWCICRGGGTSLVGEEGMYIWHETCEEIPDNEQDAPRETWILGDREAVCILCDIQIPDEVQALFLLHVVV